MVKNDDRRRLPPEIVYEVLEHCLFVSPEALFSAPALFWGYRDCDLGTRPVLRRSVHLLRVCRQWHALALPLLYAALWISSTADAEAIAHALRSRPPLCRAVRALRVGAVEDGFGDGLQYIVAHAPHLRAVRLQLDTSDWAALNSLDALARALPCLRPTVLWVSRNIAVSGRHACRVAAIFNTCLAEDYTHLEHLHLGSNFNLTEETAHAIRQCPRLNSVSIRLTDLQYQWPPSLLNTIDSPRLQTIRCRVPVANLATLDIDNVRKDLVSRGVDSAVVEKLTFIPR
ncbi:hypothetical protein PHLGIDRAFT_121659 [Phlebiopsis gigantea 11061_1 CR5-6]|uniref:F-box domain-containing protein n=1 Tax=Phlebiopsis gigantea (strain 11061_1 CR5-6) TaxID=745531 RepID=A0A0C3S574_PHLG1|nr:hypothetical protein PHLGIDRAFT_121659 [Phlebiopsis gigantea 11061_1 CR5-6]